MGNSIPSAVSITIHYPTSLEATWVLKHGTVVQNTTSMVRISNDRNREDTGCKGRITFKKTVKESEWSYKYTKSASTNLGIELGYSGKLNGTGMSEKDAEVKLAITYGISRTEAEECFTLTKSMIDDENNYSELLVHFYWTTTGLIIPGYVHEYGKKGECKWTARNDLNLECSYRWAEEAEDLEMIIDVKFR